MLEHINRSDNRFELKYLVGHDRISELVEDLRPYLREDANWENERGYPIHSVYWDSDEWTFFWEKIEGLKDRRKLRARRYAGVDYGFIEIKHRTDRTLQKRRARVPLDVMFASFRGGDDEIDPAAERDDAVLNEALYLRYRYRLKPKMAISYRRRAFYGFWEPDLRVTIDSRVQYHSVDTDISRPFETGTYLVDPRVSILEIKFNDRVPTWLVRLVSSHGLQMIRLSKYCTAVDLAHFDNQLT